MLLQAARTTHTPSLGGAREEERHPEGVRNKKQQKGALENRLLFLANCGLGGGGDRGLEVPRLEIPRRQRQEATHARWRGGGGRGGCLACVVVERSEIFRKCVRAKKSGAVFVELREKWGPFAS